MPGCAHLHSATTNKQKSSRKRRLCIRIAGSQPATIRRHRRPISVSFLLSVRGYEEPVAPPEGGDGGSSPPYGWTSKNYVICVCCHCHGSSSYRTTNTKPYKFPMHCSKCVSFWGTSYSRPPIDPYLTSPCYKILAAPL